MYQLLLQALQSFSLLCLTYLEPHDEVKKLTCFLTMGSAALKTQSTFSVGKKSLLHDPSESGGTLFFVCATLHFLS